SGIDPYWMKLTNLVIHLLNGLLVFLLARALLKISPAVSTDQRAGVIAALIAAGWMLLPINLTGVLYVVQRMESMANLFVLLGLLGYIAGRRRMLSEMPRHAEGLGEPYRSGMSPGTRGFLLCVVSIVACTGVGALAKETAVMLPLYAMLIEWLIFGFRRPGGQRDFRLISLCVVVL